MEPQAHGFPPAGRGRFSPGASNLRHPGRPAVTSTSRRPPP